MDAGLEPFCARTSWRLPVASMAKVGLVRRELLRDVAASSRGAVARATAFEKEGTWVGRSRVGAELDSGGHPHGEHDTYLFVTAGRGRIESGPGGADVVEIGPGDVAWIPAGTIHRERTGTEDRAAFVARVGRGELVFPSDGPE